MFTHLVKKLFPIFRRNKYLFPLLLLLISLHSCSMCTQHTNADDDDDTVVFGKEGNNGEKASLDVVGYPIISDTIPSKIFKRICYSLSYNNNTRQPNWVMWQLKGENVLQRKNNVWNEYREDFDITEEYRAKLSDYASSGYDRGHMCPGGDCNWNDKGRDETFLLSNICPQNSNLNRGDWKEIEIACRKWAQQYGSVYIVCGPLFLKSQIHERIGDNQIPVPEAFFKVILHFDSISPKGIGFICRNTDGNRKKDFYVNSIRQVERVTGYKFFPSLTESIKSLFYDMSDIDEW